MKNPLAPFYKGAIFQRVYVFTHTCRGELFHKFPFAKVLKGFKGFPHRSFSQRSLHGLLFSKVSFHLPLGRSLGLGLHADLDQFLCFLLGLLYHRYSFLQQILDGLEPALVTLGHLLLHFLKCCFQTNQLLLFVLESTLG